MRGTGPEPREYSEDPTLLQKQGDAHETTHPAKLNAAARHPRDRDELTERLRDGSFSDDGRLATSPPVVEYGREFQTRAADERVLLPKGSAIAEMLADYGVMREQALSCRKRITLYSPNSVRSRSSISAESMPISSVVVTRIPASPSPSSSGNTP